MSTSLCGKIGKTPAKCLRKERRQNYYPAPCPGDAVFCCESTLFGLLKEDTTRNQWLSCIYKTVPEQYNANIRVCAAHFTEDYFLNLA